MLLLRNNRKNSHLEKRTKITPIESGVIFRSMIRNDLFEFDITGSTLYINRTTAVLKVEKYIIASITASPIGCAVPVLLAMHVETFKSNVICLKMVTS